MHNGHLNCVARFSNLGFTLDVKLRSYPKPCNRAAWVFKRVWDSTEKSK